MQQRTLASTNRQLKPSPSLSNTNSNINNANNHSYNVTLSPAAMQDVMEVRDRCVENIWDVTVSLNILYRENWTRYVVNLGSVMEFLYPFIHFLPFLLFTTTTLSYFRHGNLKSSQVLLKSFFFLALAAQLHKWMWFMGCKRAKIPQAKEGNAIQVTNICMYVTVLLPAKHNI